MGYQLGVDLGTTFTAAAVARGGRSEIVSLGSRTMEIPSVVFLSSEGVLLVGEAALRRGAAEPSRLAREFKRRLGDPVPLLIGGAPHSPEDLMAAVLAHVVDEVSQRQGESPDHLTVTHPANWGPYKRDLFELMLRLAGVEHVSTATEPEAAAVNYASTTRVAPGEVVAVYDLGGGTFDAAVLRKSADGFELLGQPDGIEHLGGADFDEAVFASVTSGLGAAFVAMDGGDPRAHTGISRLRQDCIEAKEALSFDTEVSVSVVLPGINTFVRLTRTEFEDLVRPALLRTVTSLDRALRSAGLADVGHATTVVLAGGSSRIPLIGELVQAQLGLPVAVGAHAKHAVALGAAQLAAGAGRGSGDLVDATTPASGGRRRFRRRERTDEVPVAEPTTEPLPGTPLPPPAPEDATTATARRWHAGRARRLALVAIVAALLAGVVTIAVLAGGDDADERAAPGTTAPPSSVATTTTVPVTTVPVTTVPVTTVPVTTTSTTVAVTTTTAVGGDGGRAVAAVLSGPDSVQVDGLGSVYVVDTAANEIRQVSAAGIITTIAGTGTAEFTGDAGPARLASVNQPEDVAVDAAGNVYISDTFNNRIRKIDLDGVITTWAGNGSEELTGDGGPATEAGIDGPGGLAFDAAGNLYVTDTENQAIRKITTDGIISTVAGTGVPGFSGDGGPAAQAELSGPEAIAIDASGDLYIVDRTNQRIRRVTADGIITTVVGIGVAGFSGDGGAASGASIADPDGAALDAEGTLYVSDSSNNRIRRIEPDGSITTMAGTGALGFGGDGGLATAAVLAQPGGLAFDGRGNLYVADTGNARIRMISPDGIITTVAGGTGG